MIDLDYLYAHHACGHCPEERCVAARANLAALVEERTVLRNLVSELAVEYHQTGSIRAHADPDDRTGWNVHGIETCDDLLCRDALDALHGRVASREGSGT